MPDEPNDTEAVEAPSTNAPQIDTGDGDAQTPGAPGQVKAAGAETTATRTSFLDDSEEIHGHAHLAIGGDMTPI